MASKILVGDFETTVYEGQSSTEVWASAVVELWCEDVVILHSIEDTFDYLKSFDDSVVIYYHNLKFDGAFWLDYLMKNGFRQALDSDILNEAHFIRKWDMKNSTFSFVMNSAGQFYKIIIKYANKYIEIRDSFKLLPFSVEKIGKSFGTKHRKLSMKYEGYRYAGCEITDVEKEYIANDVLVVKEALEIMFADGHKKLTIGSCCLSEYKNRVGRYDWEEMFPNLTAIEIDESFGSKNADEYVRKSYKGGWCYLKKGMEGTHYNGETYDVNSLYPSVMSSESGNYYPVGIPHFWKGEIPAFEYDSEGERKEFYNPDTIYFFVRVKVKFRIKKGHLPFIQKKGSWLYKGNVALETSNIIGKDGTEYEYMENEEGKKELVTLELTLTKTDYFLMISHYDIQYIEYLDGCWFYARKGIFDDYINHYKEIKIHSKGAKREQAKLFLNNLYGKLATSTVSDFKVALLKDDGSVGFITVKDDSKKPVYIPCGSAITSYARYFTITTAQQNYDKFIYADTDSIHCLTGEIKGVKEHPTDFCCWKHESTWDVGHFVRQKTYIEHVIKEDGKDVTPYYNIKCAGMNKRCKQLFEWSMTQEYDEKDIKEMRDDELEFVKKKRELRDFTVGLKVPSKLRPKRICGGIVLVNTTFEMREMI